MKSARVDLLRSVRSSGAVASMMCWRQKLREIDRWVQGCGRDGCISTMKKVVRGLQEKFAAYAEAFNQANGMLQINIWSAP